MDKTQTGFTLTELLIVVAIIGILAAVSAGFFGDNVTSARRTDGRALLMNAAASMEKCKAVYGAYNNAGCSIQGNTTLNSADGYYTAGLSAVAATSFTLTARPAGAQAGDALCTSMTINHLGVQGGTPATNECW